MREFQRNLAILSLVPEKPWGAGADGLLYVFSSLRQIVNDKQVRSEHCCIRKTRHLGQFSLGAKVNMRRDNEP
jgi:hypothetical protein